MTEDQHIEIATTLAGIAQRMDAFAEAQKDTAASVRHLEDRLFVGNGQPGVLPTLETRIDRVEQIQSRRSGREAALWAAIIAIIAAVVGAWWQVRGEQAIARTERNGVTQSPE